MTPEILNAGIGESLLWFTKSFPFMLALHLIQVVVMLLVIRFADFNEREPIPVILGMFLWGGMIATAFSAVGNGIVSAMLTPAFDAVYGAAVSAPLVEEFAKGAAIWLAFWATRKYGRRFGSVTFGGVTDGIVYGAAAGAGFGFFENVHYFVNFAAQNGVAAGLDVFTMRVDLFGFTSTTLLHVIATAFTGAGLGLALWAGDRRQRALFIAGGFGLAVLSHMSWNGLTSFLTVRRFGFDAVHAWYTTGVDENLATQMMQAQAGFQRVSHFVHYAFLLGMVAVMVMWLRYESRVIRFELGEEVQTGLLSSEEYGALTNVRGRSQWYAQIARSKRFETLKVVRQAHDKLIELALEKWRVRRLDGDPARLVEMRAEVLAYRDLAVRIGTIEEQRPVSPTASGTTEAGQPLAPTSAASVAAPSS